MAEPVQLLTLEEAAKRLRLSRKTLERYIKRGELRVVRFGASVRITERELAAFVASRAA